MYLICYGTRPEMIKMIPLINKFKERNINFKTLFSGQHLNLFNDFKQYLPNPGFVLENIMEHGQSLNKLSSKIMVQVDNILEKEREITYIIIQGDTTTAYTIALAGFHYKKQIVHLEAGLRTHDKYSPFPEEMNRSLISKIANIHLCPTNIAVDNLERENIKDGVYNVGNTIVDVFDYMIKTTNIPENINEIIEKIRIEKARYIIITLHRRENRGEKMGKLWEQLNAITVSEKYKTIRLIYITHPALPESREILNKNIILLDPLDYVSMVHLIYNSSGMITDSGGLQEEAVCANKKVLVCRDTTERPETIESGYGKLVDTEIIENVDFLLSETSVEFSENPYGKNVCEKIVNIFNIF